MFCAYKAFFYSFRELQHRLIGPNAAVTKVYGVPGLKAAMDIGGHYFGGVTRRPLQDASTNEIEAIKGIFRQSGF